jgi:hypothetical protein
MTIRTTTARPPRGFLRDLSGRISRLQGELSDRFHATWDGRSLSLGWSVATTTGRLGFAGRTYRDRRFDRLPDRRTTSDRRPVHSDRNARPAHPQIPAGRVTAARAAVMLPATAREREARPMSRITNAQANLETAFGMPAILTASYSAFDQLLLAIREHEERAEGLFAAFVMAAVSAADGRDALTSAPSLPLPLPRPSDMTSQAEDPAGWASIDDIADEVAGLGQVLADRLTHIARQAGDPLDRTACANSAQSASAIRSLLARPGQ